MLDAGAFDAKHLRPCGAALVMMTILPGCAIRGPVVLLSAFICVICGSVTRYA